MVVAEQMQEAVDNEQLQFGRERMTACLGLGLSSRYGNNYVAEITPPGFRIVPLGRKRQDIGGVIVAEVRSIELSQDGVTRQPQTYIASSGILMRQGRAGRRPQAARLDVAAIDGVNLKVNGMLHTLSALNVTA